MTSKASKLPTLLASLSPATASSSRPILIRPTTWPRESFYLLTRHSLKFPLKSAPTARAKPPAIAKNDLGSPSSTSASGGVDQVGNEQIRVAGKAWGVKFWNGRPIIPASPRIPDPQIPHSLVEQWTSVDLSSLSQSTRDAVTRSHELVKGRYEERNNVLASLSEGKRSRLAQNEAPAQTQA